MLKTADIRIRDPYIVVYEDAYYMFGTVGEERFERSLYVYRSTDLSDWEEPKVIYTLPEDGWAEGELWAPEVHLYHGRYYLFISIMGKHGKRGTQILVCDVPDGTYVPLADHPQTPMEFSCIDGTLYVEDGVPYMVYSKDWAGDFPNRDVYVGEIWAVRLTDDLADMAGEPFCLFTSDSAPYSSTTHAFRDKTVTRYGSDAPFVMRLTDGTLYMTWSPIPDNNYIVSAAVSDNGTIHGNWKHLDEPLFDQNGGHAMFFTDLQGQRKMCIHHPEKWMAERALFVDVEEEQGCLRLK